MTRGIVFAVLVSASVTATVSAADWPQWRGPERTGRSAETGLLRSWPEDGPTRLWLYREAGIGYAGFAVVGGRLYTMGARNDVEYAIAVDTKTGTEIWAKPIGERLENNWGDGPRGTPTVDDGLVYALSARGNLVCLRAKDGKKIWSADLVKKLGGKIPHWGYTESVLVDGNRVVCTPGGRNGAIAALHKQTGKPIWRSKGFRDGAQYSSIIAVDLNGERQYVQLTMETLVGVSAKTGRVLWQSDWPGRTAVIPTPINHGNRVYISSGYGVGCKLVEIGPKNRVEEIYANRVMKNHHGGVIRVGDYLYGYSDGPGWVCQNFATGEMVWNHKGLGKGCLTYADGMLICVDERNGDVALVEATPEGWKGRSRFRLSPQTELRKPAGRIWTHPVVSDGRLYLRDQELVYCYDIRAESAAGD